MSTDCGIRDEAEADIDRPRWTRKSSGVTMHPEVRRALRARAALEGVSMPVLLHRILVGHVREWGLVAPLSGQERPIPD